jgi:hypothetical protein
MTRITAGLQALSPKTSVFSKTTSSRRSGISLPKMSPFPSASSSISAAVWSTKFGKAKEAASQFFTTANPQDEFFLVSFNERAELVRTFTNTVEDLQSRLLLHL